MRFQGLEGLIALGFTIGALGLFAYFISGLFGKRVPENLPAGNNAFYFEGEVDDTNTEEDASQAAA